MDRVRLSAPASSANLGPGYDCLAVALPLRTRIDVARHDGPLAVDVTGEGADELPADASNLVVRAFAARWAAPLDGLAFRIANGVPLRAGAGSSAAAIALGLGAAQVMREGHLDAPALVAPAAALEGHADNVAAALLGGFTVAAGEGARRIEPPSGLAFLLVVPADGVDTTAARAILPDPVARADAVHALQHTALLVDALHTGELEAVAASLNDRLHEAARAPLAPLLGRLRAADLPGLGVTLSGAGPSVLVWARAPDRDGLADAVRALAPETRVLAIDPERDGLRLESS
jgi:homoserine kinase